MSSISTKGSKIIRICCEKEEYNLALNDRDKFRTLLDRESSAYPELFPNEIINGYSLEGKTEPSKKKAQEIHQNQRMVDQNHMFQI